MMMAMALAAATAQPGVCAKLTDEYEMASKRLAVSTVEDRGASGDRRIADIRAQAGQTLELIKAHKCRLPTSTPNPSPYYSQALICFSDRVKFMDEPSEPKSCDMMKWIRQAD